MAHGGHGDDVQIAPRVTRALTATAIVLAILTAAGVVVLWSNDDSAGRGGPQVGFVRRVYEATVVSTTRGPCRGTQPEDRVPCDLVQFRLTEGPDRGDRR